MSIRKNSPHPINPIPTGLGHVTLIYGLIPPMAGRNRVKQSQERVSQLDYHSMLARATVRNQMVATQIKTLTL